MRTIFFAFVTFLAGWFKAPRFDRGDRVNHVPGGCMRATDGYVVAQDARGVLVEFRKLGQVCLPPTELCRIG